MLVAAQSARSEPSGRAHAAALSGWLAHFPATVPVGIGDVLRHHRQPLCKLAVQSSSASSAQGLAPPALCLANYFGAENVPGLRKVGRGMKVCAVNGSELRKVEGLAQKNSRVEPGSILLFKIGYYSIYIL